MQQALLNLLLEQRLMSAILQLQRPGAAFFPLGKNAAVNIDNCIVEAKTYCVATNSGAQGNFGVKISIANSKLTSEQACAVMLNIPGTLDMNNCTVTGSSQAVMVRAGKASISNCDLSLNGTPTDEYDQKKLGERYKECPNCSTCRW